jgi:single-strand DNA-binding protein
MAGEIQVTVVGTLTADPELKFTSSGKAVANFTIAQNPRVKDGDGWKNGEATFLRASVWGTMGENVVETLRKGDRVIAQGGMRTRSYETQSGEKRSSLELLVEAVGPDLRYATATVEKVGRDGGSAGSSGFTRQAAAPTADPWGAPSDGNPPF